MLTDEVNKKIRIYMIENNIKTFSKAIEKLLAAAEGKTHEK